MRTRVPMKAERHGNQLPQTVETRWRVLDDRQNGLDRVTIRERVYPEAQAQLQPGQRPSFARCCVAVFLIRCLISSFTFDSR
jgi:hypothetical protein